MPKILVVEDNETNRVLLRRRLERKGDQVITANDGEQGYSLAHSEIPDVILMNISLLGMNGWQVAQPLRANDVTRNIPIIVLTAHALISDREKAFETGCNDYETKPIEFGRLHKKSRTLCWKISQHRSLLIRQAVQSDQLQDTRMAATKLDLAEQILGYSNRNIELSGDFGGVAPEPQNPFGRVVRKRRRHFQPDERNLSQVEGDKERELLAASSSWSRTHGYAESLQSVVDGKRFDAVTATSNIVLPLLLDNGSWKAFVHFLRAQADSGSGEDKARIGRSHTGARASSSRDEKRGGGTQANRGAAFTIGVDYRIFERCHRYHHAERLDRSAGTRRRKRFSLPE